MLILEYFIDYPLTMTTITMFGGGIVWNWLIKPWLDHRENINTYRRLLKERKERDKQRK